MPTAVTASMLYDLVMCPHRVTMDLYADPAKRDKPNPFVKMLWERGSLYERESRARRAVPRPLGLFRRRKGTPHVRGHATRRAPDLQRADLHLPLIGAFFANGRHLTRSPSSSVPRMCRLRVPAFLAGTSRWLRCGFDSRKMAHPTGFEPVTSAFGACTDDFSERFFLYARVS